MHGIMFASSPTSSSESTNILRSGNRRLSSSPNIAASVPAMDLLCEMKTQYLVDERRRKTEKQMHATNMRKTPPPITHPTMRGVIEDDEVGDFVVDEDGDAVVDAVVDGDVDVVVEGDNVDKTGSGTKGARVLLNTGDIVGLAVDEDFYNK